MVDLNRRLSPADQVFVNAMAVIAASGVQDTDKLALAIEKAREVLPQITRGHPLLEPVAEQADRMVQLPGIEDMAERREVWSSIRFRAACALGDFFFWRLGLADAALAGSRRPRQGAVA